jgi:hypothetical protein
MTDLSTTGGLFDPRSWFPVLRWQMPNSLVQPILPGWSVGNVIVNEENSSSPETEERIVSAASYGKQIGRLMDAVCELIERQKEGKDADAFVELRELQEKVDRIKKAEIAKQVKRLAQDLERLKKQDETTYRDLVAELQSSFSS